MDEFIDNCLVIVSILGLKAFEKIEGYKFSNVSNREGTEEIVTFSNRGKFPATATLSNQGFILLKGSHINPHLSKSCPKYTRKLRQRYEQEQKIVNYVTTDDLLFNSPSAAAAFVSGSPTSGNVFWKNENDLSPKDIYLIPEHNQDNTQFC